MIPRGSRLAIWCVALLLSLSLYMKGRAPTGKGEGAAFSRPAVPTVTVRLSGDFPSPGIYSFPHGVSPLTAIKMTLGEGELFMLDSGGQLASGDIVTLKLLGGKSAVITVVKMGVKERMLLSIPLDPDLLEPGEWSCLPGIGPVLSARIVADRHKNGAFGSLEGVQRVPGIGAGKLSQLRRYF